MDVVFNREEHELKGASVHHLETDFVSHILEANFTCADNFYTIEPVVVRAFSSDVLCPLTQKLGSSYVDAVTNEEHVGRSNYMLSYSWMYPVGDVTEALSWHCSREHLDKASTYFWICCLCVNQHRVLEVRQQEEQVPFEDFRNAFQSKVHGIGKVLALMAPWDKPVYVGRVWCIFELFTSLEDVSCSLNVLMPPSETSRFCGSISNGAFTSYLWTSLEQLDVRNASSSVQADKERILQLVQDRGGFDHLNQVVRQRLLRWLAEAACIECSNQISIGRLTGDPAAIAASETANLLHRLGKFDEAQLLLETSRDAAFRFGDPETIEKANLWRVSGKNYDYLGRNDEAAAAFHTASEMLQSLGALESHDGAALLTCVAANLQESGRVEEALMKYRKAWEVRQSCGSQNSLDASDLLAMMGVAECRLGASDGVKHAEDAKELRVQLGQLNNPHGAYVLQQLGICYFMTGNVEAAIHEFEQSRQILEKSSSLQTPQGASLLQRSARCFCKLGDLKREQDLLREARKLLEEAGQLHSKSGVLVLLDLGSALLDSREDTEAKAVLELAEAICTEKRMGAALSDLVQERLQVLRRSRYCAIS